MVIRNQMELTVLLAAPKKSLPKRILVNFKFPDFGDNTSYVLSSEGQEGEYVLVE